jgi:hypothetical protein
MTDPAIELALHESRVMRRLSRLFRIERHGCFTRQPIATVHQLLGRRARLVGELAEIETERRSLTASVPAELRSALGELTREVGAARQSCAARIEGLAAELRQRHGAGRPTGLRGSGAGHLLGSG